MLVWHHHHHQAQGWRGDATTPGDVHVGCRCVVDVKPRVLSAEEYNMLSNFAELSVRQLEKDHLLQLQRLVRTLIQACSQLPASGRPCRPGHEASCMHGPQRCMRASRS